MSDGATFRFAFCNSPTCIYDKFYRIYECRLWEVEPLERFVPEGYSTVKTYTIDKNFSMSQKENFSFRFTFSIFV